MAINLVIVFDGPGRPSCKRSTRVITDRAHFLTNGLRSLAEAFGFVTYVVSTTTPPPPSHPPSH